ncbi:MAG: F0F1 ATP synthase subunit A, partial [Eubacterium sp.]
MAFAPITMNLQEELTDQLEIATWKEFTIGGVHITIDECTVVSWIIMIVMTIIAILLTRNLKVEGEISKRQALLELCYEKAEAFFKEIMGPNVQKYIPYLMSVAIFIGVS